MTCPLCSTEPRQWSWCCTLKLHHAIWQFGGVVIIVDVSTQGQLPAPSMFASVGTGHLAPQGTPYTLTHQATCRRVRWCFPPAKTSRKPRPMDTQTDATQSSVTRRSSQLFWCSQADLCKLTSFGFLASLLFRFFVFETSNHLWRPFSPPWRDIKSRQPAAST